MIISNPADLQATITASVTAAVKSSLAECGEDDKRPIIVVTTVVVAGNASVM